MYCCLSACNIYSQGSEGHLLLQYMTFDFNVMFKYYNEVIKPSANVYHMKYTVQLTYVNSVCIKRPKSYLYIHPCRLLEHTLINGIDC